jgi:predicted permease
MQTLPSPPWGRGWPAAGVFFSRGGPGEGVEIFRFAPQSNTEYTMSLTRFFRRQHWDEERARELDSYLEIETDENIARGMSPEEARYAARRKLGNLTLIREEIYRMNSLAWLETLWQDLRYAFRQLRRSPGLVAVIVLSLTLGIGANTAVFTLTNAVMFKLLPVKSPQQLVLLGWVGSRGKSFEVTTYMYGISDPQGRRVRASFAYPLIEQMRSQANAFSSVFGFVPTGWSKESLSVVIGGQASAADGVMVTGDYFTGLGIVPVVGRVITDADAKENAPRVAVISYSYWTRRFGRDPSAAGMAIFLNGVPFTIVGVAPPEFFGVQPGHAPDIWIPLLQNARLAPWGASSPEGGEMWTRPDWWWVTIMARLKPGVGEQAALAAAQRPFLESALAAAKKELKPGEAPQLVLLPASRGLDTISWEFSQPLRVLTVVVALVLLIACANIATLLLARATARQREIGVRLTLGASRWRLIRQLLTESVVLSAIGGILGLLLAQWGSRALLLLMSTEGLTLDLGQRPDATVLGFCAGVSVLTGILFGLVPAVRAARVEVAPTLKKSGSGFTMLGSRLRLGKALVIVQVGLSLVLLVGAGLFVRTLVNIERQNLGFNRHNLLIFAIDPTKSGYQAQRILPLFENVRERLQAVPGVRAVTYSSLALLTGWVSNGPIAIEGFQQKPNQDMQIYWDRVGPGFFETMGIRTLLGRTIDRRDTSTSLKVALVNEAMARYFFGEGNPIGRRFSLDEKLDPAKVFEIVGVVENAKYADLRTDPRMLYIPVPQEESGGLGRMFFEVRTAADPSAFIAAIRGAIREIDSSLALESVKTQTQQMDEAATQERMFAELCSFFSLLALGLAAIGLYGLMAYSVGRRTNEIGIRMALGAQRRRVFFMILRQSIGLVALGVVAGLLAAMATTRLIASELYGLKPTDPLTLGFTTFFMLAVAALAAYLPARRATKVDPMMALRYE